MPSPSEGSLSSGGMDQGSDAPAQDYDVEVSEEIVTLLGMAEVPCAGPVTAWENGRGCSEFTTTPGQRAAKLSTGLTELCSWRSGLLLEISEK